MIADWRASASCIGLGVMVVLLSGCASTPSAPPAADVTGTWAGTWSVTGHSGTVRLTLTQRGAEVIGELTTTGVPQAPPDGRVVGQVSGNAFSFTTERGAGGDFVVAGNEMRGRLRRIAGESILRRE
jgi:hypothetical protein